MLLNNKPGIIDQVELAEAEEKISKRRVKKLFDSGVIDQVEVGTFKGLSFIHFYLFEEIYAFAGRIRDVNIAKGNFRFAPLMYLHASLNYIDGMPQGGFDQIIEKYVEMNVQQFPLEYFFFYFHIFTKFKKIIFRKVSAPELRL